MARWDKNAEPGIPDWFWQAVDTPSEEGTVEVDECDVVYRHWGLNGRPGLLLIHGLYAHSHWWDFIAPSFKDDYDVAALDLTGMGDSDYRYSYDPETYAEEICAVCDAVGFDNQVTVVAHSFGGMLMVKAANLYPDRFGGLVLVDSGPRHPDEETPTRGGMMGGGRVKVYPDRDTAINRFRLQPPQPCDNEYIVQYIARHSVMPVDDGWAWKFDEELMTTMKGGSRRIEDYQNLRLPLGVIYGADSALYSAKSLEYLRELAPHKDFPAVALENAQHHLFLDQPLAFIDTLKEMLPRLGRV